MKLIKALAVCILVVASVITIFTACDTENNPVSTPPASSQPAASQNSETQNTGKQLDAQKSAELKKDVDIQSGAKVTEGYDEKGNQTFQYENPDGTGGGGVALD